MGRARAGQSKDMEYEAIAVYSRNGMEVADIWEADDEHRWAVVGKHSRGRSLVVTLLQREVTRTGGLTWDFILGDFKRELKAAGFTLTENTYVMQQFKDSLEFHRSSEQERATVLDHGQWTELGELAPPPHPYDVADFAPPRTIAVGKNGSGAQAWITPHDGGRQWMIEGDPAAVEIAASLIEERCRTHDGWTNWAWLRGDFDKQLRKSGYSLARLAVGTGASDSRLDVARVSASARRGGRATVLVDGGRRAVEVGLVRGSTPPEL